MQRKICILIVFIFLTVSAGFMLLPIPLPGQAGVYNTLSGWMWCEYRSACLHETGHQLDREAGWISHSQEFGDAAQAYVIVEFAGHSPSELAQTIINLPGMFTWDGYFGDRPAEIYATIFERSSGRQENMPDIFVRFYDWERADELIHKLEFER